MYIQLRNRKTDPTQKSPVVSDVKEVCRFLTHPSTGRVEFNEWSNEEIRLKPPPAESDLKNYRIDLNLGFNRYYEDHVKKIRRSNGCQNMHHNDARHLEKDDTLRQSFEATLKWIKETDYIKRYERLNGKKPKVISTSTAIQLLLTLPYENEEKNCPSWLISKHKGILYLFSVETFTNPNIMSDASNNKYNIRHHHIFQSEHFHHNGHCNGHTNGNGCIDMGEKAMELLRYRSKVFYNMMTERKPIDKLATKMNKCVLNQASFDSHHIIYSAVINAVDQNDHFVDLKLSLNRKSKREHLEKMQRLWAIAVLKPATKIVLGIRSGKSKDVNAVPDGRLVRVEDVDMKKLPLEVLEFSHKAQFDAPLWEPRVSFDFLKRVIDYLDNRCMDDARTVYQLVPEGFYGRGFSLLSIHKLNLKGCDPLIPEWYVVDEEDENQEEDEDDNNGLHGRENQDEEDVHQLQPTTSSESEAEFVGAKSSNGNISHSSSSASSSSFHGRNVVRQIIRSEIQIQINGSKTEANGEETIDSEEFNSIEQNLPSTSDDEVYDEEDDLDDESNGQSSHG